MTIYELLGSYWALGNRGSMSEYTNTTDKVRMTLLLKSEVKEELKKQAKELGVSPSAYVSVLVSERAKK